MARSSRRSKSSGLPHLAVGLALGLAVAAGVYFSDLRSGGGLPEALERAGRPQASRQDSAAPQSAGAPRAGAATAGAAPPAASGSGASRAAASAVSPADAEPRFDFYEILPQYEVLVPEEVETVSRPATPSAP